MFSFSGEKSNLSSGIASAASTTCFSTILISRSIADAMVGGVDGDADAAAAGEVLVAAPCAKADAATNDNNAAVSSRELLRCFIRLGRLGSSTKELVRVISKKRDGPRRTGS